MRSVGLIFTPSRLFGLSMNAAGSTYRLFVAAILERTISLLY
jgi:hypothetical protein